MNKTSVHITFSFSIDVIFSLSIQYFILQDFQTRA